MKKSELREFRRQVQPIFQDPFEVYNPFYRVDHVLTTPLKKYGITSNKSDTEINGTSSDLKSITIQPMATSESPKIAIINFTFGICFNFVIYRSDNLLNIQF